MSGTSGEELMEYSSGGHITLRQVTLADRARTFSFELRAIRIRLGFMGRGNQASGVDPKPYGTGVPDQRRRTLLGERVLGEVGR